MKKILDFVVVAALVTLAQTVLLANPTGGQVSSGTAGITTVPGTVTVNQLSNTAIINWQTFSIASGEMTKFVQPSSTSAALNRVLGGQTSIINGTLSANGQVYLINGNGIVVGAGGTVAANSFIASTRDVADSDFLAGKLHLTGGGTAGVQNLGSINALGGDVYLIGKTVDNEGTITAANGTAGLASADDVVLNLGGQEHVFVNPKPTAANTSTLTAVKNGGSISAASAELKAANGNLFALAINNGGAVRATALATSGGHIYLRTDSGTVVNKGTLRAVNGAKGGQIIVTGGSVWNQATIDASGGKGGSVTVDSVNFQNDGAITVKGATGAGGSVAVTYAGNALGSTTGVIDASGGTQGGSVDFTGTGSTSEAYLSFALNASSSGGVGGSIDLISSTIYLTGARLTANGATLGGRIFVGMSDPNSPPNLTLAQTVYISSGTTLGASATAHGNGGVVGLRSSGATTFLGAADADGAGSGESGGLVSIAGTGSTTYGGQVNARAPSGHLGTFVLSANASNVVAAADSGSTAASFEFVDPNPSANDGFGKPSTGIFNFSTNTTLITSPGDTFGGANAGAVYLFSDTNGALISTLRGAEAGDQVGNSGSVVTYPSLSQFVVFTPSFGGNMGAVTLGSDATGFLGGGGTISAANSLVGSTAGDEVGSGLIEQLGDSNLLVLSPSWNGSAGAVTWVSGGTAIAGVVSASNSLVGASAGDQIGSGTTFSGIPIQGGFESVSGITLLATGNYLVLSPNFAGGIGAVTFAKEATRISGVVSAANSLVGATAGDKIGSGGIIEVSGADHFIVYSPNFNGGAGAVTLGDGTAGGAGVVSAANSLVGAVSTDSIGSGGFTAIDDSTGGHNYLVSSPNFNGGAGAVTWGDGSTGVTGVVSAANSLVGASAGDKIGSGGIETLDNNANYLVLSPMWGGGMGAITNGRNVVGVSGVVSAANSLVGASTSDAVGSFGTVTDYGNFYLVTTSSWGSGAGAVTWNSESLGAVGAISASNSLVGAAPADAIGNGGITILSNGNYLVASPDFGAGAGAVTWGSSTAGVTGIVSASNSLVGASSGDGIGSGASTFVSVSGGFQSTSGIVELSNSNYVVLSPGFSDGLGAVTFGNGSTGTSGTVSASNSLVGATSSDNVGSGGIIRSFSGSNYLVYSPLFGNGAGAVTFASGTTGVSGVVSSSNSLVGATMTDTLGSGGFTAIFDSGAGAYNFLVSSPSFGGTEGAVTFINGTTGLSGIVSATNSLVGAASGDEIGSSGILPLENGANYVVLSPLSGGGMGAITNGSNATGVTGVVGASNSLVGVLTTDHIGQAGTITQEGSYYLVDSSNWGGGAGAITWNNESSGTVGVVSATNSLVGSATTDNIGSGGTLTLSNENYLVLSPNWNSQAGAVTFGSAASGVSGVVSAANSLVGAAAGDKVGGLVSFFSPITFLSDGNYLVYTPTFAGNTGAVTWGSETSGVAGVVSASNSLVGAAPGDTLGKVSSGTGIVTLSDGNYLVETPLFNGGAGAVTWASEATGLTGVVGASNSLVGAAAGDAIGSAGVTQFFDTNNYLVLSPSFGGGRGAVTFARDATGITGTVSAANSLVGAAAGDNVGSGSITTLKSDNYLVSSPSFGGGAGAITWASGANGITGVVGAGNSLVGVTASDAVGSGGIMQLIDSGNYLVLSGAFGGGKGAVTFGSEATGVSGVVSASNSLIGAAAGDNIGSGGITQLFEGATYNYLVLSPKFGGNAGAVTFGSGSSGVAGVVGAANSLVGAASTDKIGSGGITQLFENNGENYLVQSPLFGGGEGAITFGSGTSGVTGIVGAGNSLIGAATGDSIGSGGIIELFNETTDAENYLVLSPLFAGSTGAATFGSGTSGVSGIVGGTNSIIGGQANAGLVYGGLNATGTIYLVIFTTDTSKGGESRVLAGSVNGGSFTPGGFTPSQMAGLSTFSSTGLNQSVVPPPEFFVSDPDSLGLVSVGVDAPSETGGATNTGSKGKGRSIATGSSLANAPGPKRLIIPGSGVWNIFGGLVHAGTPPTFVVQRLQVNLSPAIFAHLQQFLYSTH